MLSLRESLAVVNLYEELGSYRAVAALVGCDHKTVKAWLEREQRGESAKRRPRATDAYLPLIRSKLESSQGKIKASAATRAAHGRAYGQLARAPTRFTCPWAFPPCLPLVRQIGARNQSVGGPEDIDSDSDDKQWCPAGMLSW